MRKSVVHIVLLAAMITLSCSCQRDRQIEIFATTDVHGSIFSRELITGEFSASSISKVSSFIGTRDRQRSILLDNGDNLQGSPAVYFSNFEDTSDMHLWARVVNYLGYDAITVGNHDIEAGHTVYDRIRKEYNAPMLAANATVSGTGEPYFTPYVILDKKGIRVAVIGLITPGIPGWLPTILYEGIEFGDMTEAAAKYMEEVKKYDPDIVVGLFHSGWNQQYGGGYEGSYLNENASLDVVGKVQGFDVVFIGHDHDNLVKKIQNQFGDSVLVIDGGSHARFIAKATIKLRGRRDRKEIFAEGELVRTEGLPADDSFDKFFEPDYEKVRNYVSRPAGLLERNVSTREAYFGDSPFIDLINRVQLEVTGADVSFAAPLSFDVTIGSGEVSVLDMFDLYRYENMLYTMKMTGAEIDRYLEYSCSLWFRTMKSANDTLLLFEYQSGRPRLKNRYYNFDSAEGIDYLVDISKPAGERVEISGMTGGGSFNYDSTYKVAVNSYRGSGGGDLMTRGAGIDEKELSSRIIRSTDKDLRYYMIKYFESTDTVKYYCNQNWSLYPVQWAETARKREMKILFNE